MLSFRIRVHILLSFFSVFWLQASGQHEITCDSLQNLQVNELIDEALVILSFKPLNAGRILEEAFEVDPENAEVNYLLGTIEYNRAKYIFENNIENLRNVEAHYLKAEEYFHRSFYLDSTFNRFSVAFFLGEFYYNSKEYNLASKYLNLYVKNNNFACDTIKIAGKMLDDIEYFFKLLNNPVPFTPKAVQGVCTEDDEYLPYISPDGQKIYFTHRFKRKSRFSGTPISIEEFSVAERLNPVDNNFDKYTEGKAMGFPFNQGIRDQGGISLTIDNTTLFITICSYIRVGSTSYKNCDIYTSVKKDNEWQSLKKLGPNINSDKTWEGQPGVTADGNGLFFASAREGGYGGIDIYRSRKDSEGNWGPAQNLGSVINTKGDDKTPFVHTDSQTLYFSSNGHRGIGGFDIFYSSYLGLGRWSKPINIGYPINTFDNDLAFIVSTNGQKIYFASNKLSKTGDYDIYSSPLYEEAKPQKVLFVNGTLTDEYGETVGDADVELQNIRTLKLTKGLVDENTGQYAIATAVDTDDDEFILTIKKQGYFYDSKRIKPGKKMLAKPPTKIDFEIRPIKVGTRMRLKNIYFEFNSALLNEKSIVSLNNFSEFLILNPNLHIELIGHTDNVGDEESNLILSTQRAKAVYDFLIKQNINADRINYKGLGEKFPIASNSTKKGRKLNRRTEFVVTIK